jgi:poly(3-hydroxyalkanoate) synthetase
MHPFEQHVDRYIKLYEHVGEPDYRERIERFAGWFEHPIDLPGRWHLQVVQELFNDNRFFNGHFQGLGRKLAVADIHCPVFLLAGHDDDITPPVQVHNATKRLGTPPGQVKSRTVTGGHVGLFMSHKTVGTVWPEIAAWIRSNDP